MQRLIIEESKRPLTGKYIMTKWKIEFSAEDVPFGSSVDHIHQGGMHHNENYTSARSHNARR